PPLAATAGNISGRTKTTAATSPWTLPGATADEAFSTPDSIDLLSVVQEIVNRPGWCGGNAITFIIEGTGTRRIKSAEQSASQAPQFSFSYEPSATTGCYVKQDTAQIATGNDDAEEESDGDVDLNSGDLDIDGDNDIAIGLRFQNVQVPQGATIQNATVKFKSQDGDSGSVTYRITGQAVDDAPAFSTTDNDISSRQRTSQSVTWSI